MISALELKIYGILEAASGSTVHGQGRNVESCPSQKHTVLVLRKESSTSMLIQVSLAHRPVCKTVVTHPLLTHCPNAIPNAPDKHLTPLLPVDLGFHDYRVPSVAFVFRLGWKYFGYR